MASKFETAPPPTSVWPAGEAHSIARGDDGTRLFVRAKDGDHPEGAVRAFLCDGILCDGFIWKYLWDDLAATMPLTHWHYRGHGRSAPPADPDRVDIAAHADDLMAVRRASGDPPAVLIGHSMGCQVALECYHRHPDKVRGLVLICGSFGNLTSTVKGVPLLDLILPKLLRLAENHTEMARAIWSRIPPELGLKLAMKAGEIDPEKIHPEDILPYLQHMTHVELPLFLRMLRAAGEHSAEAYLKDVNVPTLLVSGERDSFTPAFLTKAMAEAIPGAETLEVAKGTHVASIEQPELVDGRIIQFIRERVL